jgi:hypothetical protein
MVIAGKTPKIRSIIDISENDLKPQLKPQVDIQNGNQLDV